MQDTLTCPYCNAILTDAAPDETGRCVCSMCDESFEVASAGQGNSEAIRVQETGIAMPSKDLAPQVQRALQPDAKKPRPSNRSIAIAILTLMFVMAAAGLALALWTQKDRRENDKGIVREGGYRTPFFPSLVPRSNSQSKVTILSPHRLMALRYFPRKTNLLVGVHLAELLQDPLGRELLGQPIRVGPARFELTSLAKWTGLPLDVLDHCVLGLSTHTGAVPRINVVVRTRRAYDERAVRSKLDAMPVFDAPGEEKSLYHVTLQPSGLKVVLWCADDRTLVYGFLASDLREVPRTPHANLDHLPPMMGELLRQRVGEGSPVWASADIDDWASLEKAAWFRAVGSKLSAEDNEKLHGLRACVAWLQLADKPSAWTVFRCGDEAEAIGLAEFIAGSEWRNHPRIRLELDDAYLTLRFQTSLEQVRKALGR